MKTKELPSLDYLKECFALSDSSESQLVWLKRPLHHFKSQRGHSIWNKRWSGKPAGSVMTNRTGGTYFKVGLDFSSYLVHRIVFSLHTGENISVELQIDHEDGNGLNNKPNNLRVADQFQNMANTHSHKDSRVKLKGVSWHKQNKRWQFQICHKGKHYYRHAETPEEAFALGKELRESLHGKFTRHQ